jgi:hypothetical protein
MSESFEYSCFTVLQFRPGANDAALCSLVLGISVSTLMDLITEYPDNPIDGRRNPMVEEAILAGLPQPEGSIRECLIRKKVFTPSNTKLEFQAYYRTPHPEGYEGKSADFVSADGKKFWIERLP